MLPLKLKQKQMLNDYVRLLFLLGKEKYLFERKITDWSKHITDLCPHLDECEANVASNEEDVEIGRCVTKHLHIECTNNWEVVMFTCIKI